jgi:hypothetical protein
MRRHSLSRACDEHVTLPTMITARAVSSVCYRFITALAPVCLMMGEKQSALHSIYNILQPQLFNIQIRAVGIASRLCRRKTHRHGMGNGNWFGIETFCIHISYDVPYSQLYVIAFNRKTNVSHVRKIMMGVQILQPHYHFKRLTTRVNLIL